MKNQDPGTARSATDAPDEKRLRRSLGWLTILLLLSWLLMMSGLPISLLSGVTGLVALILLVRTTILSARAGRRGSAVTAMVFGLPATLMIVVSALMSAVFYGPMAQAEDCQRNALTEQARAACATQIKHSSIAWMSQLFGD